MYELKTKVNKNDYMLYINSIENSKRRIDSIKLVAMIKDLMKIEPKMWGDSIIGFGDIKYTNSQKKEYEWFKLGFSPRKNYISLYLTAYSDYLYQAAESMNLKHGKGCIYIKDLDMVDLEKLRDMIQYTIDHS